MESLLVRYRNITLLLLVVFAQVILLAIQVKNKSDVRMIRVWSVTAVTPIAELVEGARAGVSGFFGNYVSLKDVREEGRRMHAEIDTLKLENQELKSELAMSDRAKALSLFAARTPSKMLAARIIGNLNGATNKVAFVDRGSNAGVQKGMAVVTADGIAGKVLESYPTASQILMVDDPGFAAGVISQKNHVRGILMGLGHGRCKIEFVQNEEKVDVGEIFYTSGDDRVFPKGMPAAKVMAVSTGTTDKQIAANPLGLESGAEEVLIVIQGVHQEIPEAAAPSPAVYIGPDPPPDNTQPVTQSGTPDSKQPLMTDADRLREKYRAIGEAQNHTFGEGTPGSTPPNFNLPTKPPAPKPESAIPDPARQPEAPKPETPKPEIPKPEIPKKVPPQR
jgi:rod shape-determining protein MreC